MANTVTNVTVGKPKATGGVWVAPYGTALPTDAKTELAVDYKCLGYLSEDGVSNSFTKDHDNIKSWGGVVVLSYHTETKDEFVFTPIENKNTEVIKMQFGDDNVTGTLETGITAKANASDPTDHVYVIEVIERDSTLHRIVIPVGKVTALGDIVYKDDECEGRETTLTAQADDSANTHYEYWVKEA